MSRQVCSPRIVGRLFVTMAAVMLGSTLLQGQNSLPTASISYPADGATVSGQTYITLTTEFQLPLTGQEKQQIFIDGNLLWASSGILKFVPSILWNTTTVGPGTHTVLATVT